MDFYFTVNPSTYRSCEEFGLKRVYIPYKLFREISISKIAKKFKEKPSIFLGIGKDIGKGKDSISVAEYGKYIKENADVIDFYTNLDTEDPKESYANLVWLENSGLTPIPVWHITAPIDDLEEMCKKYEYISIGGGKFGVNRSVAKESCRYIFSIIEKYNTKLHADGMAFINLLRKYPFYSVSTSSWTFGSRFGLIYSFDKKKSFISRHWKEDKKFVHMVLMGAKDAGVVLNENSFRNGDGNEIDEWNLYAWKRVAQELEYKEDVNHKRKDFEIKSYFEDNDIEMEYEEKDLKKKRGTFHPAFIKNMGAINEKRKDATIEKKRVIAHKKAFKNNLFRFEHGNRATKLPLYCNNCYVKKRCKWSPFNPGGDLYDEELAKSKNPRKVYCALRKEFTSFFKPESFGLRDQKSVDKMKENLMSVQMTRAAMNYYFEILDGGIQDRSLTNLLSWIYERLDHVPNVEVNLQKNVLYQTAKEIRNQFTDKQKDLLLNTLKMKSVKEAKLIKEKNVKSKEKRKKSVTKTDK